ncbi:Por secretion system C-terminal sorting domain-containing protein [Aquimarina amphilecti]|uniref:Por secretion system C-terminal sorting domain-containing protein n=1 Tax=Aquimarina amphilecti TaxID=1038014 RepID=A0A1H7T813_AQUAM|nr:expansin EXLX1 family cellulose-binding protein [Aquimarina amphilecti]SEL80893.1 Por secretion system C-terminal sorting domain-containing protein [Aquimarina amphilecti]
MKSHIYIFYFLVVISVAKIYTQECNNTVHTGEGTFYDGVAGGTFGNCSLPVAVGDYLHCALNNFDYDGSDSCGACIEVTGAKGSVIVNVVDRCPECASGDVDMTIEAFEMIADVVDGRVPISWKFVPCETILANETIKINFKEGSSEFWTAIQFRNINHAISKMEYQLPDNTWKNTNRELFNFFIETSGIPSPMNLRVTSILGEVLIFENIVLNLNEDFDTGLQFSTPEECNQQLSVTEIEINPKTILYPNPTSSIIHLTQNANKWKLVNSSGKTLDQGSSKEINMSSYSNGIYYLLLKDKKTMKVVKQ